jgi:ABC-type branched-subunit amino acid transport system ATPase component/predicted MFS family arabinose efflux permease
MTEESGTPATTDGLPDLTAGLAEPTVASAASGGGTTTAALVEAVLDAEAERDRQQREDTKEVIFADDLLPGVGGEEMSLREGLAKGGSYTFIVLIVLYALDQLQTAGLSVLAPNIRDTFGISNGTIIVIASASGAFLVLGAVPMGYLADRFRRGPILGWAGLAFSAFVVCSGLANSAFAFFWARLGVGVAQSSTLPVSGSLIADTYPIGIRGRIGAANGIASGAVAAISPLAVGGIATVAGGGGGWRWAFFLLGLPVAVVALFAFRIKEPPRGQFEKDSILGEVIEDVKPPPISIEAAFSRLFQIRTVRTSVLAFAAIGFGLFSGPVLGNLFLQQHYGLDAFQRGLAGTIGGIGVLVVLPFVGRLYDALYHRNPPRAMVLVGMTVLPSAILTPIQYFMPQAWMWIALQIPQTILMLTAFTMFSPIFQTIVPYRMRGLGTALGSIYVFFVGATGGAILAGLLTNAFGVRAAVIMLLVPSTLIGGLMIIRGSTSIRGDLSMIVAELQEELAEHERQQADPENVPAVQMANIDFAYGQVQVLFDVSLEVRRGEVLALLGTNGAGKSTVLRMIAGLGTPSRGVVRLDGRTITLVSPEQRARLGIQMLPGGKGVFPEMSVQDNLEMGSFAYRGDPEDQRRRIERAFDLFPDLDGRRSVLAGSLSGGQQQMLALARVLLHDPEVLLIDELSLGLAPVVVQELIAIIERLRTTGMTIVVVEQSLNVAAAISDRAVFLEKGQVRFDGPTAELIERDDLARAVFLGSDGG